MKINTVTISQNNQKQDNGLTDQISTNLMNTRQDHSFLTFKDKSISFTHVPNLRGNMNEAEYYEFAKRSLGYRIFELKAMCGCKGPIKKFFFGEDSEFDQLRAKLQFEKILSLHRQIREDWKLLEGQYKAETDPVKKAQLKEKCDKFFPLSSTYGDRVDLYW